MKEILTLFPNCSLFIPRGCSEDPLFFRLFEPDVLVNAKRTATSDRVPSFFTGEELHKATIRFDPSTTFYGTGEVTGPLERSATAVELWNTGHLGYASYEGERLYQSHPYVLAVHADGTATGIVGCSTRWGRIEIIDQQVNMRFDGEPFPVIIFEATSPLDACQQLANLFGTLPLPPLWSLGYHQCRFSYETEDVLRDIAQNFRARDIPCDALWLDIDYMQDNHNFTVDRTRFPNPADLMADLKKDGFHNVWIIDPYLNMANGTPAADEGNRREIWIKDIDGNILRGPMYGGLKSWPDLSTEDGRCWLVENIADFLNANGIDGIWNDKNEPNVNQWNSETIRSFPLDAQFKGSEKWPQGEHLDYHNLFATLQGQCSVDALRAANPDRRPFVLSRAGFIGDQRYAAAWSGDNYGNWQALKTSIPMSMNHAIAGQVFQGADIPGFTLGLGCGAEKRECLTEDQLALFKHWYALGVFYPFFRGHANKAASFNEPWSQGVEAEAVARTAIRRRYRLLPYLYTLFQQSSKDGSPIMRPVFFADPSDPTLRTEQEALLLGSDLLVVPRWSVSPSLPKGIWHSVSLVGESLDDTHQPDVRIRGGAIVPLGRVVPHTGKPLLNPLTLLVSLDENCQAEGTLYEDAGDGYGYRTGQYRLTTYRVKVVQDRMELTVVDVRGDWPAATHDIRVKLIGDTEESESVGTQHGQTISLGRRFMDFTERNSV